MHVNYDFSMTARKQIKSLRLSRLPDLDRYWVDFCYAIADEYGQCRNQLPENARSIQLIWTTPDSGLSSRRRGLVWDSGFRVRVRACSVSQACLNPTTPARRPQWSLDFSGHMASPTCAELKGLPCLIQGPVRT